MSGSCNLQRVTGSISPDVEKPPYLKRRGCLGFRRSVRVEAQLRRFFPGIDNRRTGFVEVVAVSGNNFVSVV